MHVLPMEKHLALHSQRVSEARHVHTQMRALAEKKRLALHFHGPRDHLDSSIHEYQVRGCACHGLPTSPEYCACHMPVTGLVQVNSERAG